jgi:hypothetical protein
MRISGFQPFVETSITRRPMQDIQPASEDSAACNSSGSLAESIFSEMNLSCWTSLLSQVEPCNGVSAEMDFSMAGTAKYDEIFFDISSKGTARLNVMDLEILGSPASLTSPAITGACGRRTAKAPAVSAGKLQPAEPREGSWCRTAEFSDARFI